MTDLFYSKFEERYRGSRDLIKTRAQVYLPFLKPLNTLNETPYALDLGCGRGEWLELIKEHDFHAKGVDCDEGMLLACREFNLDVEQTDIFDYLKNLESNSQDLITAFHVVEHIQFESVRLLVDEAYRVLKPNGLLILETPNSANIMVGTSSFYLDPTHIKPLPAELLSFVVEYAKFDRVKTLYLNEKAEVTTKLPINLLTVLGGVSPDYAIIAQKQSTPEFKTIFDIPFNKAYGVNLNRLIELYDQQLNALSAKLNEVDNFITKIRKLFFWKKNFWKKNK